MAVAGYACWLFPLVKVSYFLLTPVDIFWLGGWDAEAGDLRILEQAALGWGRG